jgi:predicted RNA-binding Zn-ribbon protein involved in translation (DUF1610 family)
MAMAQSLLQFQATFADDTSCAVYLFERRWPDGFVCPVCGGGRAASLKSRAHTYECLACGRQTSITAGTVMHRSKLPLTVWFWAAYLVATEFADLRVREFEALLGVTYKTAWLLRQKLIQSMVDANHRPLEGLVEVGHTEIPLSSDDIFFAPPKSEKVIVAAALGEISRQIRLAAIPDGSASSIEAFVRANVKRGAKLLTRGYLELTDYLDDLQGFGKTVPRMQRVLSSAGHWHGRYHGLRREHVGRRLDQFVVHHNNRYFDWHVLLDNALGLVSPHEPANYWDIIGRDNPRKGVPVARRLPRRRKTAIGMREDGPGSSQNSNATPAPD